MSIVVKGPWQNQDIDAYLGQTRYPIRIACNAEDGFPRVVSLWYHYRGGRLLCVTHQSAAIHHLLRRDNKIGFEVAPNEPPYHGVRGQGLATLEPLAGDKVLESLIERYLGDTDSSLGQWLLSRSEEEILITIEPSQLFCWDYRRRMADAVN